MAIYDSQTQSKSTRNSRRFRDIDLDFTRNAVTNDVNVVEDVIAVKRSVRNLVQTIPTERFFNSVLGSDVRSSLFEFVDYGTASTIQDQIEIVIENFEPRVENLTVEVLPVPDLNEFEVTVFFDIVGQEIPTQEFSFILEATR